MSINDELSIAGTVIQRMTPEIVILDKLVADHISYEAWTALSYLILENVISDKKNDLSKDNGSDIGTLETINHILYGSCNDPYINANVRKKVMVKEVVNFRAITTLGYLLGTNFAASKVNVSDELGNRFDGELKRYHARVKGISPQEVNLSEQIVNSYCRTFCLDLIVDRMLEHYKTQL